MIRKPEKNGGKISRDQTNGVKKISLVQCVYTVFYSFLNPSYTLIQYSDTRAKPFFIYSFLAALLSENQHCIFIFFIINSNGFDFIFPLL